MNESVFEKLQVCAKVLNLDIDANEMAILAENEKFSSEELTAIDTVFEYLKEKKIDTNREMLLRVSRLPKNPAKTFENFDFSRIHGKGCEELQNLPTLSALYARRNIAFIGPQGVGKTHLAIAYGMACCEHRFKTYFLKATELNQRMINARRAGRESTLINSLVKPSCLIIDEIGRCVFDETNTRMFFDIIDRRYSKEGANTVIFTSNSTPDKWRDFFSEDDALLCSLDRIFDNAVVFMIKGDSYRGQKLQTISLEAGKHHIDK